jgi:hypothetical protein
MKQTAMAAIALLALTSCAGRGRMDEGTSTGVQLTHNNYRVLKAGAAGTSTGFWVLFIPIKPRSYADAKADLYKSVGQPLEGRSVALANQTEDWSFFTLLLFSLPKLTVTADVVEFTDTPTATPNQPPITYPGSSISPSPDDCTTIGNTMRCGNGR